MLDIAIWTIPHKQQLYDTCGDYWTEPDGSENITVSNLGDWRMEVCVAVHELIEKAICKHLCISEKDIDAFDMQFEKDRVAGKHSPTEEPGEHPDAPYRQPHFFAESMEKMLAHKLGVDWAEYTRRVRAL